MMKKRSQERLNDYPEIVSKLLLLHESGLTIQNVFSVILKDYKSKNTAVQRCHLHVYIKLGTLLEQNIKKGSPDLHDALNQEVRESFSMHQNHILQSAQKAGTKLLLQI